MQRNREKTTEWERQDLFKKIRVIKGTFTARIYLTSDRDGKDLTKAKEIKNRWQEYT